MKGFKKRVKLATGGNKQSGFVKTPHLNAAVWEPKNKTKIQQKKKRRK